MTPAQQRIMELFKCDEYEAQRIIDRMQQELNFMPHIPREWDMFPVDWAFKDGRYHAHQTRRMRWDLPYSTPGINDKLMKLLDPSPEELERRAKKLEDFKMIYGGGSLHITANSPLFKELKMFNLPDIYDDGADTGEDPESDV